MFVFRGQDDMGEILDGTDTDGDDVAADTVAIDAMV